MTTFFIALLTLPGLYVRAQVINTVAGNGLTGYYGDNGPATAAALDSPGCVAVDAAGNIYISDQLNNCIRKVNTSGIITTIAGTGTPGFNGDGIAATAAQLSSNWGLAVDASGNVYVADQTNNRIRKINTSGIVSTVAGSGVAGFYGDGGPATDAKLNNPIGIAVDGAGNIYIGDANNYRVRKVSTSGIISTIAGNGASGFSGDGGPATAAQLKIIWGIATDAAGYVYICDAWNNRIRRADPAAGGLIVTVAGNGYAGDGSAATAAKLNLPTGAYVNGSGELFIADCKNNRIRKVSAGGTIGTMAGAGTAAFGGDEGLAVNALLYRPLSVCGDDNGGIYIADLDNVRVRKVRLTPLLSFTHGHNQTLNACQDLLRSLDTALAIRDYTAGVSDSWSVVTAPLHGDLDASYDTLSTGNSLVPHDMSYRPAASYLGSDNFTVRVTNGALADTTIVTISVSPIITSAGRISGTDATCVGAAISLSDNLMGGTWACSNTSLHLSASGNIATVTGASPGVDTVLYTISNGCSADTAISVIQVYAVPDAGSITGSSSVCIGDTLILTDAKAGGIWASVNAVATVNEGKVTAEDPGIGEILYVVSNAACADTTFFIVHVDTFPQLPVISGPGNVCVGAQVAMDGGLVLGTWSSDFEVIATVDLQTGIVLGVSPGADSIRYSISNTCGIAMAAMEITVNPLPEVPAIRRKENVLWRQDSYAGYQWIMGGTAVAGAISDSFTVTGSGEYGVVVTSSLGCRVASQPYNYPGCLPDDLELYPNPVWGTEYVIWCDKTTVRVATADGRVVLLAENTNSLDMSSLPAGVYLLTVYDASGRKVKSKQVTKIDK